MKNIFRPWVPKWFKPFAAFIILIPVMLANGSYTGSSVDISGALGVISEDINMSYFMTSAGMAISYPLILKIRPVVTTKLVILMSLIIQILLSFICIYCAKYDYMLGLGICSFFIGFFKSFILLEIISIIIILINTYNKRSIFYAKFYPITISISQISLVITSELAYKYSQWEAIYYLMIILLLFAIIVVLLCFRYAKPPSTIPLKDADWISVILISILYTATIFVLTYGKTLDWFSSSKIFISVIFIIPITFILFIRRQLLSDNPYVDVRILKNKNTFVGYIFIIISMIFISISTLISTYATNVLKLESARVNELYLFSIPGFLIGSLFCIWWFKRERYIKGIFLVGFLIFLTTFILFYYRINSSGLYSHLFLLMFLRGIGMMIFFVSFAVYVIQGIPQPKLLHNAFFLIGFRSAIAPAISYSLYTNWIYRLQAENTMLVSQNIFLGNPQVYQKYEQYLNNGLSKGLGIEDAQKQAINSFYSIIQKESLTLSIQNIVYTMIVIGLIVLVITIIYPFNKHKMRFMQLGRDMH